MTRIYRVHSVEEPRFTRSVFVAPDKVLLLEIILDGEAGLVAVHPLSSPLHQRAVSVRLSQSNKKILFNFPGSPLLPSLPYLNMSGQLAEGYAPGIHL